MKPTPEEARRICDAQQPSRERRQAMYETGKRDPSRWDDLYPCPGCGVHGARADANHSLCRRCEGYSK